MAQAKFDELFAKIHKEILKMHADKSVMDIDKRNLIKEMVSKVQPTDYFRVEELIEKLTQTVKEAEEERKSILKVK